MLFVCEHCSQIRSNVTVSVNTVTHVHITYASTHTHTHTHTQNNTTIHTHTLTCKYTHTHTHTCTQLRLLTHFCEIKNILYHIWCKCIKIRDTVNLLMWMWSTTQAHVCRHFDKLQTHTRFCRTNEWDISLIQGDGGVLLTTSCGLPLSTSSAFLLGIC